MVSGPDIVQQGYGGVRITHMSQQLIHFSDTHLASIHDVEQTPLEKDPRPFKPRGLWVSVEGNDDGWKAWCEGEQFSLPQLARQTEIILAKDANILWLKTSEEIDAFTESWGLDWAGISKRRSYVYAIDWPAIAKLHDGIIIAPYCWERRMTASTTWYYTWDCASGCIWNARAIQELRALPSELDRAAE